MKNFDFSAFLARNSVTILFSILCAGAFFISDFTLTALTIELFTRFGRNTFIVLSLLIPVVAGLGMNFGIVIGAMAAQIAIFIVVLFGGSGLLGLLICVLIATPLAIVFGYLVGRLFNSMKGTEMIGGLIAGFFSDGLYQFLFLFVLGGVITINNPRLMISTGVGVQNLINLNDSIAGTLDRVPILYIVDVMFWVVLAGAAIMLAYRVVKKEDLRIKRVLAVVIPAALLYASGFIPVVAVYMSATGLLLLRAVELLLAGFVIYNVWRIIYEKKVEKAEKISAKRIKNLIIAAVIYGATFIPVIFDALIAVRIPVLTYMVIGALCLFIPWFMNTKLGQDMRTVGQDRAVATSSGINVNRVRIIAIIMSTVLASYGQLISLQNIGTVATYGSHLQVGLFSVAALLVGGASVQKATVKQAALGVILFHTLFILSPNAGQNLLGNAQLGEYFRVFVAYGVIAVALAMHAKAKIAKKA